MFNHRAWISWRYLALLEMPSRSFTELPTLSQDLQALIEATRAGAQRSEALAADTAEEILLSFFYDPADSHAKALWLRRLDGYM